MRYVTPLHDVLIVDDVSVSWRSTLAQEPAPMFRPYTVDSVWFTSLEMAAAATGVLLTNRRASVSNASIAGRVGKSGYSYAKISSAFCPRKPDLTSFCVSVRAPRCCEYRESTCMSMLSFAFPLSPIKRSIFSPSRRASNLAKIQRRRPTLSGGSGRVGGAGANMCPRHNPLAKSRNEWPSQ